MSYNEAMLKYLHVNTTCTTPASSNQSVKAAKREEIGLIKCIYKSRSKVKSQVKPRKNRIESPAEYV